MSDPRAPMAKRRPDESVESWVARVDPELARAAEEVDQTLLSEALALSPLRRLEACSTATRGLASFRREQARRR